MVIMTDLGLLTQENARWLVSKGVLTNDWNINGAFFDGINGGKIRLYSCFVWIVDDIKKKVPTPPRFVSLGLNEYIELMRLGSLKIPFKGDDGDYNYLAKYTIVENVYKTGKEICQENQTGRRGLRNVKFD
jgi:hypothetical protein